MQKPSPVIVAPFFPELLTALLELLRGLDPEAWSRPTVAEGWSIHDVALHLLGDEIGMLSRKRDNYREATPHLDSWEELVRWLNTRNNEWVKSTRRISPRLICDLLEFAGRQVNEYFASLDPYVLGSPVSWVGPEPAPVWLDLAREFTERWHHQQHIRDACGKP
ncbi:MAG TPA: maleylpyruvate isomerase N-terminal domain-containing protein, partial [Anaerolineae bacterium]